MSENFFLPKLTKMIVIKRVLFILLLLFRIRKKEIDEKGKSFAGDI